MRKPRFAGAGARANDLVDRLASRVDGQTEDVAERAAQVLTVAVRLLRWPTLAVLVVPLPFIAGLLAIGVFDSAAVRWIALVLGLVGAAVSLTFALRRHRIWRAVDDPAGLGTELGIAVSLSGQVDQTRGALREITSFDGVRIFSRLSALWRVSGTGAHWIDQVGDLPRARYFFPPKVGSTVMIFLAALWLVPLSVVAFIIVAIAALAN